MPTPQKTKPKSKRLWARLGPGLITGASDDDPSGIATYSQSGASFGLTQLWTPLYTLPLMVAVQEMCGRIGLVTGRGLAAVIREHYPKWVLYGAVTLLLIANTVNIGADLGAMAAVVELVVGGSFVIWLLLITAATLALEIFVSYKVYARYLKWLTFSLFAYIIAAFLMGQNWGEALRHLVVPSFSWTPAYIMGIIAILGTTISPYLFFWQTSEEVEEEVADGKLATMDVGTPRVGRQDVRLMRVDTIIGMLFSNVVMFFIMVTAAGTLAAHGVTTINTAADAAEALRPLAGNFAFLLFSLGVLGTGLLAVPVLAGSGSYAVAETMGWRSGLYNTFSQAHGFYGVITIATLVGLIVNFIGIPPFAMLYYTAVLNGIIAPFLLVVIVLIASNKKIMGRHTNGWLSNLLGWATVLFMAAAGVALFIL